MKFSHKGGVARGPPLAHQLLLTHLSETENVYFLNLCRQQQHSNVLYLGHRPGRNGEFCVALGHVAVTVGLLA